MNERIKQRSKTLFHSLLRVESHLVASLYTRRFTLLEQSVQNETRYRRGGKTIYSSLVSIDVYASRPRSSFTRNILLRNKVGTFYLMAPPVTMRLDPMEHVFVHGHVNGIRLFHGDRYVLLHRYGHVFLHRDRYHLLHGKRDLFLHWNRHSLHHGDRHRLRDRYVNWKRLWYSYGDRMWNSYRHWLSNWHTCGRIESPN